MAIIDSRPLGNVDPLGGIHTMHHSFALKERIRKQHGHALNHAVWRGTAPASSFDVMDQWLSAVEADTTGDPLEWKLVRNRPFEAVDSCTVGTQRVYDKGLCDLAWPYHGAPRIEAGAPVTHDVFQCQTKPLDRSDPDYGLVPFTDLQWDRLVAVFGETGVCDWTKPSAGLSKTVPWQTYANGPGGVALGSPPISITF